jgi:hypothetical protein
LQAFRIHSNLAVTYEAVRNARRVGDHGRRHGLVEEDVVEFLLHIALASFGLAYLVLPFGDLPSLPHLNLQILICVRATLLNKIVGTRSPCNFFGGDGE